MPYMTSWSVPRPERHKPQPLTREGLEELRSIDLYPNAADLLATVDALMKERDAMAERAAYFEREIREEIALRAGNDSMCVDRLCGALAAAPKL